MTWYRITFEETELRECLVEADSADEARDVLLRGDVYDSSLVETVETSIVTVEEEP